MKVHNRGHAKDKQKTTQQTDYIKNTRAKKQKKISQPCKRPAKNAVKVFKKPAKAALPKRARDMTDEEYNALLQIRSRANRIEDDTPIVYASLVANENPG